MRTAHRHRQIDHTRPLERGIGRPSSAKPSRCIADGASALATGSFATSPTPLLLTQSPTVVGTTLATFLRRAGTAGIGGVPVSRFTILGGPFAVTQATINAMGADL